ncbi:similar to Fe65 [Ectocarpus siliculosus]|uniref:Similar to Fe65 n=1 Tax=Ectocarpus siliculosus TaxID=2880 RepID=D7G8X5_ECTSI|nr:similar to Fe65 [Ectocarpus siliculosus]|eukprot:CBJ28143.1 similar to Fe65 [Ectocarpus siliculosus]
MGRRPVRRAAPPSDGAVGGVAGIPSPSSSAAAASEGKVPAAAAGEPAAAAAAAAPKGDTGGKNPLMGLLHYGSDSEEEEPPAQQPASASSVSTPDPSPAESVTYTLPTGWQQCMDNAGLVYFWNTETGDTSWDPPEGTERKVSKASSAVDTPSEAPPIVPEAVADAASREAPAGSDATSDTASEAEEDKAVAVAVATEDEGASRASTNSSGVAAAAAAAVSEVCVDTEEVEKGAVSGEQEVADSAIPKRSPRSATDRPAAQDRRMAAVGEEQKGEEELPQQSKSTGTGSSDVPVAATAGIDDLLAGIEAELLLGAGDGEGDLDGDKDEVKGSAVEENGDTRATGEEEDFAPLQEVAPGLDVRAQEAHAELAALLAVAAEGKGEEAGLSVVEATDPSVRLGIELAAVLRARLSDWRQGECMDGIEAALTAPSSFSSSRRWRWRLVQPSVRLLAPQHQRRPDSLKVRLGRSSPLPLMSSPQAVRAARNAEKLKWADEVSAAASAAVAAAAAHAQAKKELAKAESEAKVAVIGTVEEGVTDSEGSNSDRRGKHAASGDDATSDKRKNATSTDTLATARAIVEGTIDLGGVGDDDDDDDDNEGKEDGEVTVVPAATEGGAATSGAKDDAPSVPAPDTSESGIVIAKDPTLPDVPSGWSAVFDTTHQAYYYHNLTTDETSWVLPATVAESHPADSKPEKSSPERDERPRESKKSKADEGDASTGGGERRSESSNRSRRRGSPGDEGGSERAEASAASNSAGKSVETKLEKRSSRRRDVASGAASSEASQDEKPAPAASTDAAAKEGDSASIPESLSRIDNSTWVPVWDDNHQAFYYHDTVTDETSWDPPAAASVPAAAAAAAAAAASAAADDSTLATPSPRPSGDKKQKQQKKRKSSAAVEAATPGGAQQRSPSPEPSTASPNAESASTPAGQRRSPSPVTADAPKAHSATEEDVATAATPAASAAAAEAPTTSVVDLRPCTLVWWSDAGDVWNGVSLSGLLGGYGPRRYRNLGGGYYMTTLERGPEWATAAVAALGQGVADPVAAARMDWVSCTASAPGYGLFLRFSGEDDEQKLFDVPDEYFDDPPPDPAVVAAEEAAAAAAAAQAAALAEAEAAMENAEMDAAAAAAVAATEEAEAAGSKAAAAVLTAPPTAVPPPAPKSTKKRKSKGSSATGKSGGSIGKKRKGAANLIDKWKAVASTAGEEAEKEAEKQEKMERWKARAAAMDPDNPNFTPIGKRRR